MNETATHVGIARARAAIAGEGAVAAPTVAAVRAALATVMDPELPMVSIVDLGMVGDVTVGRAIRVELLPTFVGCPAIEMILRAVESRLAAFDRPADVVTSFAVPWSSDRISADGRRALASAGIAPPTRPEDVRCPWCASPSVVMDSAFGPTQCRSLYYCRGCRQPFEAIKPI